jgi:hypothetical protein
MQNDNCFAELTKRRECKHRTNAKGVNNVTVCCSKMAKLFGKRNTLIEGESHAITHKSSLTAPNGGKSLAELRVVCTVAGELGKLTCQTQCLNTVR